MLSTSKTNTVAILTCTRVACNRTLTDQLIFKKLAFLTQAS